MKSNYIAYDFDKSLSRLDEILNATDNSFEELDAIPSRDKLTYSNGFYVQCSALFVDIRGSSKLTLLHKRPVLAKIYRSFISEVVAVLNGNETCIEINIHGDCVWGVFDTVYKHQTNNLFSTAAEVSSIVQILNCKLRKKNITTIRVGIGLDYGRALMIKAGYYGSKLNDVVWMGDVVNKASELCSYGNKASGDRQMMISEVFYSNLNEANQKLLDKNWSRGCYHGDIHNIFMNEWVNRNCNI